MRDERQNEGKLCLEGKRRSERGAYEREVLLERVEGGEPDSVWQL